MNSYPKKQYGWLGMLGILTAAIFISSHTLAAIFSPCIPRTEDYGGAGLSERLERNQRACDAENAVYASWEEKLSALDTVQQDLRASADSENWTTYAAKWTEALPVMKELQAAALANRKVSGAVELSNLYSRNISAFLQNANLGTAGDLDTAVAKILTGLKGPRANAAATAGINLTMQSVALGKEFVQGLGKVAYHEVQLPNREKVLAEEAALRENVAQQISESKARRAGLESSDEGTGYLAGVSKRTGSIFTGWLFWLVIVCFLGGWLGLKHRKNPIQTAVAAGIAFLIPGALMMLALVFLPFVPQWFLLASTAAGTVAMYYYGGTVFGWIAYRVGAESILGRQLRIIGGMLDVLRTGFNKSGQIHTDGNPASAMAANHATHGSARWGSVTEMRNAGHLVAPGVPCGFALARAVDAPAGIDQRFRFSGHVVTVAPTGSGKGIGAVIPNLLDYPGSALVLDVKGENAAVTARARRELGHKVFIVDPFGVTKGETHAFNLLDRLNPNDPECVSESATLADCLVIVDAKGGDGAHFDESAKTLLQGLMLYVVGQEDPTRRNLGELRRMITAGEEEFDATLAMMAADDAYAFGIPARAANTLMGMADRERGSVLSTARRHTAFLDDPRIAAALSRSDFDLANIKVELMTVYLVLPANKIGTNARFVRGFIGAIISAITSSTQQPPHRVAFLLDEFGQLGYMKSIEDAVSLLRGYGLSFWVFIQDLSQLKGVYPKWQTFLANSAKTFYGTDDYDTAKYVSDSLGQATIEFETHNEGKNSGGGLSGGGGSMNRGASSGSSQQFTGRHLLTPDEVMRLGPERPIVLLKGEYPYQLTRLNYLVDPEYVGKADSNPYHT